MYTYTLIIIIIIIMIIILIIQNCWLLPQAHILCYLLRFLGGRALLVFTRPAVVSVGRVGTAGAGVGVGATLGADTLSAFGVEAVDAA